MLVTPGRAAFSSFGTLSAAGGNTSPPQVAVDPEGNTLVVWSRSTGTGSTVQARYRAANGVLGPVEEISGAGDGADSPSVAMDPQGRAFVVWREFDPDGVHVKIRRRLPGGGLSAPQNLSSDGDDVAFPVVGADGDGDAIAAWRSFDGADYRLRLRRRAADGTLDPIENPAGAGGILFKPAIAVQPGGAAVAVWERSLGSEIRIQTRRRSAGGALGPLANLSAAGQNAAAPQVDFAPGGDAVFAWTRSDGSDPGNCCSRVQTRRRAPDGTLTATQTLSGAGLGARLPELAVGSDGTTHFTWTRGPQTVDECCTRIEVRRRSPGGLLTVVEPISVDGQNAFAAQIAVDGDGDTVHAWQRDDGSDPSVFDPCCTRAQVRVRSPATGYAPTQTLSASGQDASFPDVAVNSGGEAAVAWRRFDGAGSSCCLRVQGAIGP